MLIAVDPVYILCFSMIMLSTDVHNVHITKLTQDVFLKNHRGINGGKDFPEEFLKELYTTILGEHGLLPGFYLQGWGVMLVVVSLPSCLMARQLS